MQSHFENEEKMNANRTDLADFTDKILEMNPFQFAESARFAFKNSQ